MTIIDPKTMKNQGLQVPKPQIRAHHESGSAIIWILVMVGIFAALNFALSQGSRTGESQMSEQEVSLAATEILDYATAIKRAVQELQINGCSDEEIDFGNNVYKNAATGLDLTPVGANAESPADGSCGTFHPNGGGLRPIIFQLPEPTPAGVSVPSGHAGIGFYRKIIGIGDDNTLDLIIAIVGMNEKICLALNKNLGVSNPSGKPPVETTIPILGDEAVELVGKNTFCYFRNDSNQRYTFIQVLIAR